MKYPGTIPNPELEDWFSKASSKAGFVPILEADGHRNPCVRAYGPGPTGEKCKNCRLFVRIHKGNVYFKCELRGITNGPGTDHRANWPACKRFVQT